MEGYEVFAKSSPIVQILSLLAWPIPAFASVFKFTENLMDIVYGMMFGVFITLFASNSIALVMLLIYLAGAIACRLLISFRLSYRQGIVPLRIMTLFAGVMLGSLLSLLVVSFS